MLPLQTISRDNDEPDYPDKPVYLEIVPIRYSYEHCDNGPTTTEQYDWVDRNASITKGLEDSIMRAPA